MITTQVLLPVMLALNVAHPKLPPSTTAIPVSNTHDMINWVIKCYNKIDDLDMKAGEVHSRTSSDQNKINDYLKENGFDLQCNEAGVLTVAAILKSDFLWKIPGKKSSVTFKDNTGKESTYPVVSMEDGYIITNEFGFHADDEEKAYKLIVETKNGNYVMFNDLFFPMVDLDRTASLEYLVGLPWAGCTIQKAMQQTQLKIDEKGAYLRSAVLLSFTDQPVKDPRPRVAFHSLRRNQCTVLISHPDMPGCFLSAEIGLADWKQPTNTR